MATKLSAALTTAPRVAVVTTVNPTASKRTQRLVAQWATLSAQVKALTAQIDVLKPQLAERLELEGGLDAEGKLRLDTETHSLLLVKTETLPLKKRTLLALGVAPTLIAEAEQQDRTTSQYVKLTPKGGE